MGQVTLQASTRLALTLGTSQLICWGISYYLVGVFGSRLGSELGWSATLVHSGFSGALAIMGLTSSIVGRWIDLHGGRNVMTAGSTLLILGCVILSLCNSVLTYAVAWVVLGAAMRMTLYEAAFATIVAHDRVAPRRTMSIVTLFGGLAATVFWPIGHLLADHFGWRIAVLFYGGFAAVTLLLHWSLPRGTTAGPTDNQPSEVTPLARNSTSRRLAGLLFVGVTASTAFISTGLSTFMLEILAGLGIAAAAAVWLGGLRGVGQTTARVCELLFGRRIGAMSLGLIATCGMTIGLSAGIIAHGALWSAGLFPFLFGAGNGLLTIARGAQPLALFGTSSYGRIAGRLSAPAFFAAAVAPIAYAHVVENYGALSAMHMSACAAAFGLVCAACLAFLFRRR